MKNNDKPVRWLKDYLIGFIAGLGGGLVVALSNKSTELQGGVFWFYFLIIFILGALLVRFVLPLCGFDSETGRIKEKKNKRGSFKGILITILVTFLISFLFFWLSAQYSLNLSKESMEKTRWLTTPIILELKDRVEQENNSSEWRWYINITNTHPYRNTGTIYLYRLEINPSKPHMIIEEGVAPGESRNFSLVFKTKEEPIEFKLMKNLLGYGATIPVEAYFVYDHISITARITCDSCSPQGFFRRLPKTGSLPFTTKIVNIKGSIIPTDVYIDSFEWVDYELEDIMKSNT